MSYVIPTLKGLALKGAARQFISISTSRLGEELGISQQMASNRLVSLSEKGLIKRRRGGSRGQDIHITKEGVALLRKEFGDYQRIFDVPQDIEISGRISSGLGEGQYYLAQKEYLEQIENKLGFRPFPGTLNITVAEEEYSKLDLIPQASIIQIGGFQARGRTFGQADCIPVALGNTEDFEQAEGGRAKPAQKCGWGEQAHPGQANKIDCAIIIPKRSHHDDVLEIISASQLRETFGFKDGDSVVVKVILG